MPLDPAKIRERREKLALTQQQAADRAGIARPNWILYESGRRLDPALSTAEKIAESLECSVFDISGD